MSMTEMLLQPLLLTTAMGAKPVPGSESAMATELGWGLPPEHAVVISTARMTKKSVTLDCEPLPLITSKAKRWGKPRNALGMVTSISRLLTNVKLPRPDDANGV